MEWNRRDFMVRPIIMAGTASVLGRTDSLLTKLLADSGPLIQRTLVECLPLIAETIEPPDQRYYSEFGRSQDEVMEYAMSSLNKRLSAIGINLAA